MNTRYVAGILLGILLVSLAFTLYVGYTMPRMGILAVSQIYVEPKGYEDPVTHEWKGSFWVVLATTRTRENYLFYRFDKSETEKPYADNTVDGKTLIPEATITVTVTALRPYWEIKLERVHYTVFPKTFGTYINVLNTGTIGTTPDYVDALTCDVWETVGTWEHHAPFKIEVTKEGDYTWHMEPVIIDLVGTEATVPRTFTSPRGESIKIQLEGMLGTGYGQPTWSDLMIFDLNNVFIGSQRLRDIISYDKDDLSYSNYWFGGGNYYTVPDTGERILRWGPDMGEASYSPAHYYVSSTSIVPMNLPVNDEWFPGSYRADDGVNFIVKPVRPKDIYTDTPDTNPPGKSLIRYLKEDIKADTVDLDLWGEGVEITQDGKLRIYQPIGSVSWLYTLWISTELADTVVYQPLAGNGKITDIEWLSGGTYSEIGDKDVALVTVKQLSPDESRIIVEASAPSDHPIKITPESDSAIMKPDEERTFMFRVENLGASEELRGKITFTVMNDLGSITDTSSLDYKLLPTGVGETILTVYTVDAETKAKLSGITVNIAWDTNYDSRVTINGMATFRLGNYQGNVQISNTETAEYQSVSKSVNVRSGQNTVYLELPKKSIPEPPWWLKYWWLLVIAAAIIASIIIVLVAVRK